MSEVKTNEPVKQEGDFKLKTKKKTPKKLNQTEDNVTKVNVNPKAVSYTHLTLPTTPYV